MAQTPPPGYGIFAVSFLIAGNSSELVNTWGFRNVAAGTAAAARAALHTAFTSGGSIYAPAFYNNQLTRVQEYVLLNDSGVLTTDVNTTHVVGTSSFDAPPRNVSLICNKHTARAGRQFRGRCAIPNCFIDESDVDDNGTIGSSLAALQAAATITLALCLASNYPLYLLHGPVFPLDAPPPTPINSLTLNPLVGTQRRRLRR